MYYSNTKIGGKKIKVLVLFLLYFETSFDTFVYWIHVMFPRHCIFTYICSIFAFQMELFLEYYLFIPGHKWICS